MELENKNNDRTNLKEKEYKLDNPEERSWWDGVKKHFKAYCEISSIQGLNYMVRDGVSWFERLWWIVVFILCVGGCSYMIWELIDKWNTTPVLVTLATKETSIHKVPFPAVTICPETKISRECVNYTDTLRKRRDGDFFNVTIEQHVYFDYMSLLCKTINHEESTYDLARKMFQDRDQWSIDMEKLKDLQKLDDYSRFLDVCKAVHLDYSYCEWMGKAVPCKDVLTPLITDEGLCYSFNMFDVTDIYSDVNKMEYYNVSKTKVDWDPDGGYPEDQTDNVYPRRAFLNGAKNAFVAVIFTKKNEIYYSCRDFSLQGIRVSLHMPSRVPRPSQVFFSVGLDRLTTVAVTPTLMSTTDTIKEYDPIDRNCYFGNERKLKYFKLYSQANCNMECWTNYTIDYCGCSHFYMPRDENTTVCSVETRLCLEEARINYPVDMLMQKLSFQKKRNKEQQSTYCNCLPICTDLNYNAEISTGKWDYFKQKTDYTNSSDYHASAIKIFFKNSYFLPTEKSELYGIVDFISNTGGILGLFTGFSLFSLAEIIYFLSVKIIENYRQHGYWAGATTDEND